MPEWRISLSTSLLIINTRAFEAGFIDPSLRAAQSSIERFTKADISGVTIAHNSRAIFSKSLELPFQPGSTFKVISGKIIALTWKGQLESNFVSYSSLAVKH